MRRVVLFAMVFAVVASARTSICLSEEAVRTRIGLSFTTTTGTNLPLLVNASGVACPENNIGIGAIVNDSGSAPLYGTTITSLDLMIATDVPLSSLETLRGSVFTDITPLGNDLFRLSGGPGIQITCLLGPPTTDTRLPICSPKDALITFSGFPENTTFTVTAVNPVPEPASTALIVAGVSAMLVRRRARSRR